MKKYYLLLLIVHIGKSSFALEPNDAIEKAEGIKGIFKQSMPYLYDKQYPTTRMLKTDFQGGVPFKNQPANGETFCTVTNSSKPKNPNPIAASTSFTIKLVKFINSASKDDGDTVVFWTDKSFIIHCTLSYQDSAKRVLSNDNKKRSGLTFKSLTEHFQNYIEFKP